MVLGAAAPKSTNQSTRANNAAATRSGDTSQKPLRKTSGKKKCLPILVAIKPLNLEEERRKFFASGFEYEPQFRYAESNVEERALSSYGLPSDKYIPQVCSSIQVLQQPILTNQRVTITVDTSLT